MFFVYLLINILSLSSLLIVILCFLLKDLECPYWLWCCVFYSKTLSVHIDCDAVFSTQRPWVSILIVMLCLSSTHFVSFPVVILFIFQGLFVPLLIVIVYISLSICILIDHDSVFSSQVHQCLFQLSILKRLCVSLHVMILCLSLSDFCVSLFIVMNVNFLGSFCVFTD